MKFIIFVIIFFLIVLLWIMLVIFFFILIFVISVFIVIITIFFISCVLVMILFLVDGVRRVRTVMSSRSPSRFSSLGLLVLEVGEVVPGRERALAVVLVSVAVGQAQGILDLV